jgi:hypothetical protein
MLLNIKAPEERPVKMNISDFFRPLLRSFYNLHYDFLAINRLPRWGLGVMNVGCFLAVKKL